MKIIGILIVLLALLILIEIIRENNTFQVTAYRVTSPKFAYIGQSRKAVFLSDLHNYSYGKENCKLLRAIREAKPDLILIGGDMLVRTNGTSYEETLGFLRQLPAIAPVYYANGNHEQRLKEYPHKYEQSYDAYIHAVKDAGIHVLENDTSSICWGQLKVSITGVEIPLDAYGRFGKRILPVEEIREQIGSRQDGYQILLAHNPSYVKTYKEWGADLILCGHFHGGMVRIPGIGGAIAPNLVPFPKYSGEMKEEDGQIIIVSKGLGAHSIPIRLFNPAELVVMEFACEMEGNPV